MATIDAWHNHFSSNSNLSMNGIFTTLEPADSQPHSLSELRGNDFLYGTVTPETGGSISVTSGYTLAAQTTVHSLKNVNFGSLASITITATATYPYVFHSFRDTAGGAGSAQSTSGAGTTTGTITLTSSTHVGVPNFYAYFDSSHSDPTT
jgi:hypothetical protein